MKNFNIKSKKGFTLIELLVVIGILAVLAAIAIPSVAGLIDRANVSADNTNANEMTNAMERFISEYELYCQDIASGTLDEDNLDSTQGRVKNVIGVTTRAGIEGIEKPQSAKADSTTGIAIYRDTKYPVNAETMKKVVENYTKTSSSTFEPKQSDCNYYYSPDCGIVVCTETDKASTIDLNALVVSGKDAKGKTLGPETQWINITEGTSASNSVSLPEKGKTLEQYSWEEARDIIVAGKATEYGFEVGSTKTLQINGETKTATIIGLNHDGNNTATFMILSSGGIGSYVMNSDGNNIGGWEASTMREWLKTNIYNSMTDVKNYIKPVNRMTNNTGYRGMEVTSTTDTLFLLSSKEIGLVNQTTNWVEYTNEHKAVLESEGTKYTWFETNTIDGNFWLRSSFSNVDYYFFICSGGNLSSFRANHEYAVCPAFVIG